jgi:hypothetical protein
VFRPDQKSTWRIQRLFAVINIFSYPAVFIVLLGFIGFALWVASPPWPWQWWRIAIAAGYGVLAVIEVLGMLLPLMHPKFKFTGNAVPT